MTVSPSLAVKLFGTDEPAPQTRVLRAGPLTAELDAGNLRYIRFGGREAIRAIAYVVRDQYWGTFNVSITDFAVEELSDSFTVSYTGNCAGGGQSFTYRASIKGASNGDLSFTATGAGDTDFVTNRTGFVVLHGVEGIAGQPVTVEHVDGTVEQTVFPEQIDPKQPIMDIRALTHTVAPGLRVRCAMLGDTFEMEDQRNWTDASYKTYVRPLALPMPYTLTAGEDVTQSVELSFTESAPGATTTASQSVVVTVGELAGKMPEIGMSLEARHIKATLGVDLAKLSPAFVSLYLNAREQIPDDFWADIHQIGQTIGTPLSIELVVRHASAERDIANALEAAKAAGVEFADIAVSLDTDLGFVMPGTVFSDTKEFDALFAAARAHGRGARIGGGNFVYFTELNRKPVPTRDLDFVMHGTSALIHAADDRSVTETLECLPYIFGSIRAQYPGVPYRISPAGIGSRLSPFGNDPTPNPDANRVTMTRADPRQRGLLGAAWHLGYVARAAAGGVDSLTIGAPTGEFGLLYSQASHSQPWYDEAGGVVGGVFPAFHVMRGLYQASGANRRATTSSAPRDVQALAFETPRGAEIWLANLTGETIGVRLEGAAPAQIWTLDADTFEHCAGAEGFAKTGTSFTGPLKLEPYAVVVLGAAPGQ
ncbi:MAG TPA: hypothetical protein VMY41_00695 [Thermohalobaculum sp.]|nr:hypothetical protein [Thermohalobaculum sp.]